MRQNVRKKKTKNSLNNAQLLYHFALDEYEWLTINLNHTVSDILYIRNSILNEGKY